MTKIILCGKPGRCCPTVEYKLGRVIIKDDDGDVVTMTYKQFKMLQKAEL